MSTITYCTGWNSIFKEPAEILTTDQARQLHEGRKPYTAIVENGSAWAVVEMCFYQAYCHVLFLDQRRRVANRYSFVETADGRLFLEEAAVNYYANDGDRPSRWELFRFKEDGSLLHDSGEGRGPITRKEGKTDVARNYSALPSFGSYESIVVRDR
jgi:hypothetical protein